MTTAQQKFQQANHEKSRGDRLAAKLRELGVDPEEDKDSL